MKNIFILALGFIASLSVHAQVSGNTVPTYGNYSDLTTTTPLQEALGVGDFGTTTGNLPQARLHVSSPRMGQSGNNILDPFSEGFLFRTDGDQDISNRWQLYTGPSATSQSERFRLYCDSLTAPFIGFRSLSNGMRFETGGSNIRMRINGNSSTTINGFTVNNSGFVAW